MRAHTQFSTKRLDEETPPAAGAQPVELVPVELEPAAEGALADGVMQADDELTGVEPVDEPAGEEPEEPAVTVATRRPPRSKRPTPMTAEPRGEGRVRVVPRGGWALVYLGSRRLGEAPGTVTLPAGSHVLQLQPNGSGVKIRRRVQISDGETAVVSFDAN